MINKKTDMDKYITEDKDYNNDTTQLLIARPHEIIKDYYY